MVIREQHNQIPQLSVLLPTRGRTDALTTSITSLLDLAAAPNNIEILLAFDNDDTESYRYFLKTTVPVLAQHHTAYTCFGFERLGYIRLNEYVNYLASKAQGRWLMFWGDDAIMETQNWDQRILEVSALRVLRMPTHNQHPYAIFPIVPRAWFELFGYISAHQLTDTWVSQIGYVLDIMQNINVSVTHDRFDITGNNHDDTWRNRPMLEGRPSDSRDFNHVTWRNRRWQDCKKLADYLRAQGHDIAWFDGVLQGKHDPWSKMTSKENDPNQQIKIQKS